MEIHPVLKKHNYSGNVFTIYIIVRSTFFFFALFSDYVDFTKDITITKLTLRYIFIYHSISCHLQKVFLQFEIDFWKLSILKCAIANHI